MLGRIFKYGLFLRLYFILKNKIIRWFYYLFLIVIIFYTHNEIKEISDVLASPSLTVWSYIIKNFLLLVVISIFIIKETYLFKSKIKNSKNDISHNINNKTKYNPIESDGFDKIRNKKYLNKN